MKVLTLDFESFYDSKAGYSLQKISTADYITDPRFQTIGVAARVDNVSHGHAVGRDVGEFLKGFDIEGMALAGHHLMFDGLLLAHHYDRYPAFYACTESMCRPFLKPLLRSLSLASVAEYLGIGEKGREVILADGKRLEDFSQDELTAYMLYCENDVRLTRDIYLWARPQLTSTEMRLIDLTLRMYLCPQLELDPAVFETGLREVRERKARILADMEVQGITGEALRSKDKFAKALLDRGIDPPTKDSPASIKKGEIPPKRTYAFSKNDPEFIALREEFCDDLEVTMLLNARISEKGTMEETRNETLLDLARRHGKYRAALSYYSAHTGRYAGKTDR